MTHGELESMQPTENPESDRTAEVAPPIKHTVPWRVTSVTVGLLEARLRVIFVDGTSGECGAQDAFV
jgi:hypothetical protein